MILAFDTFAIAGACGRNKPDCKRKKFAFFSKQEVQGTFNQVLKNLSKSMFVESAWPVEARCLLAAARAIVSSEATPEKIDLTELNWSKLLELASIHALTPALAQFFASHQAVMPSEVWHTLQKEKENVRAYNFFLLLELKRIIAAFESAQVPTLAWKGPSLAVDIYPDLALRPSADLDLLVSSKHMAIAARILVQMGYAEQNVDTGGHTCNFVRAMPKAVVELHQTVAQPHFSLGITTEELIANKRAIIVSVGELPVAQPEMLLFLLCVHASKHHWDRLIWICDIVGLLQKYPAMDWDAVHQIAKKYRAERMVNIGLILADTMVPGSLPQPVTHTAWSDDVAVKLAQQSLAWTLSVRSDHQEVMQKALYHFRMRESVSDWLPLWSFHFSNVFRPNSADREWIKLPRGLTFLYFVLRPLRLLKAVFLR